jgi:hypothetical protein
MIALALVAELLIRLPEVDDCTEGAQLPMPGIPIRVIITRPLV